MKKLYPIVLLALLPLCAIAQNVEIPSVAFKQALTGSFCADLNGDGIIDGDVDTNNDGEIQVSEAEAVSSLVLGGTYPSLTGINSFTNLKAFDCSGSHLSVLSISGLHQLETVTCTGTNLYSVTLSGLDALETLDCHGNELLSVLNLSGLDHLKTFNCAGGRLFSLDVSGMPALENLNCSDDLLTSLTVSPSNTIVNLNCSKNPGLVFNFAALPHLKSLQCTYNTMTSLDVSTATQLEQIDCSYNYLNALDISNLTQLKELNCTRNNIATLNLSNAAALENLYCNTNSLVTLDTSNSPNLKTIDCSGNNLSALNINSSVLLEKVTCNNNSILALNASNLANLTELNCSQNALTSLTVANLPQLKKLLCQLNSLPVLDLSGLPALETLDCSRNNLTALNPAGSTQLISLVCNNNQIATMNLPAATGLKILRCAWNELTSLVISPFVNLETLSCGHNQLSAMDFTNLPKLRNIEVSQNLFTSLDFSQMGSTDNYYAYDFINNPNLTDINIKNGAHILQASSHNPTHFWIEGCNNLTHVCVDDFNYSFIYHHVPYQVQLSTDCTFTPGTSNNTITGTFTFDQDNNGCDANDLPFSSLGIRLVNGTVTVGTFSDEAGNYSFFAQAGSFTLTPTFENPYFTVSPASAIVNFAAADGSAQTQNFCITPNGIHNDVEITVSPSNWARPGFDATYYLTYRNKGNQPASGDIDFNFDDAVLDFVSAGTVPNSQLPGQLHWNYSNLRPFESGTILITLNVNSPQEIPAVNIGDLLNFSASINPVAGDETIADNTISFAQTVTGSYDPNDKTCLEGDTIAPEKVGDYLHYIIRFENSGTAPAQHVYVKDVIDTEKFDIASLQLTGSSHPQTTRITGNVVAFEFENINLPTTTEDEAAGHGYIAFKIKTKSSLEPGDSVSNAADIYFDYNFPVRTNTATTTVALLASETFEKQSIAVFPNPVKDKLTISADEKITSIAVYDLQGRLIRSIEENNETAILSLANYSRGVYLVKVQTQKGTQTTRIIKE